jgi:hypothetical protein
MSSSRSTKLETEATSPSPSVVTNASPEEAEADVRPPKIRKFDPECTIAPPGRLQIGEGELAVGDTRETTSVRRSLTACASQFEAPLGNLCTTCVRVAWRKCCGCLGRIAAPSTNLRSLRAMVLCRVSQRDCFTYFMSTLQLRLQRSPSELPKSLKHYAAS